MGQGEFEQDFNLFFAKSLAKKLKKKSIVKLDPISPWYFEQSKLWI